MDEVEEIKQRLDIADVVGGYVQLKQAGRNLKAPCPFHQEKTASFMVSPEKGIYHCFGCGEGGDIFSFVMKIEGLDFRGALELLARRAGVELKNTGGGANKAKDKDRLYDVLELAAKYYQATLVKNKAALDYVVKTRGLKRQTIQDFQIGYAPESWSAVTGFLLKKGFIAEELLKAGVAGQKPGNTSIYDQSRGRVMFPICDGQGRPVGFTGRVLDDSLPKYLNTPQTALYDKSRVIYGLHLAKEAIRTNDEVVLVEGNMDVVASNQAGVKQVVAASGTALTSEQLKALSHLTKNVKLAFDADRAGLAATERAIPLAQKLGLTLFVVEITGAKDADELIAKDVKLWQKAIKDAPEIREYWYRRSRAEFSIDNNPSGIQKIQFVKRMSNILRLYDDAEQTVFIEHIAAETHTPAQAFHDAINDKDSGDSFKKGAVSEANVSAPVKGSGRRALEASVLSINLAHNEARLSLDDLKASDFTDKGHQAIFTELATPGGGKTSTQIAKDLPELGDYVKILTLKGEEEYADMAPADRSFEAFTLVRNLATMANRDTRTELTRKLHEAQTAGDGQLVHSLLEEYQALIIED
jgi:DNA primase